jgi:hypothetical protein
MAAAPPPPLPLSSPTSAARDAADQCFTSGAARKNDDGDDGIGGGGDDDDRAECVAALTAHWRTFTSINRGFQYRSGVMPTYYYETAKTDFGSAATAKKKGYVRLIFIS